MGKLSQTIIEDLKKYDQSILLVRNADQFFNNPDRKAWLKENSIYVFEGTTIEFRFFYETEIKPRKFAYDKVIYLVNSQDQVLEDIQIESMFLNFRIRDYLPEFHEDVLVQADTGLMDYLYDHRPLKNLNKNESVKYVIENYFEVDADHFGTREAVLVKWIQLYQRGEPIPDLVKDFLIQPSVTFVDEKNLKEKESFFSYLQKEWDNYVNGGESKIDFTHQRLAAILNISFLNRLLDPSETKVSEPVKSLIPFGMKSDKESIGPEQLKVPLAGELEIDEIRWEAAIVPISEVIKTALKQRCYQEIDPLIQKLNKRFQNHLEKEYKYNILPSSSINRPKVVSKILDHISKNTGTEEKVALVVIDGMAYWQWLMLKEQLNEYGIEAEQNLTYSYLPSITQLSRQALFRGSMPDANYTQNPRNESKLWSSFWENKKIPQTQIRYQHGSYDFELTGIENRLAFVDTVLDDRMHSCGTYQNLFSITKNWIKTGSLLGLIDKLKKNGFKIFLTSDHGNIQAKGWRNLKQDERFGSGKSRSKRHLEYNVNESLADEFIENNPELSGKIVKDEETLYLTDNAAFTNEDTLVTHGGSHFLEVMIPFVKI